MFGASMRAAKAQEREKHPCPWSAWPELRADQMVAEFARCTLMEARELPPADYYEFLYAATAEAEARPIAEKYAIQKLEMKNNPQQLAEESLKKR